MASITSQQSLSFRELAESVSEISEVDTDSVKAVLRALGDVVAAEIADGYDVNVPGVAKIVLRYAPPKPKRLVRNPQTGEERMADPAPAKIGVRARPASTLRYAVPTTRSSAGKEVARVATARLNKRVAALKRREREAAAAAK